MFERTTFGRTLDILERSMQVASVRRDVIANNLANAGTPNFKRSSISFEAQLGRALASEQEPVIPVKTADPRHVDPFRLRDYQAVQPRRTLDYLSQSDNNGNNVDYDQEVGDALKNQMRYESMAAAVGFEFGQIKKVLS
ncbi:flagellar basal body rod protein FlgB [Candidatus Haliotispira prima]|uniref:Flagellar basal body rod protein FlgB n=1 Tax=Candidatus Haliotispira prima TaxID=3034016 RepID=A0ABY8MG52_9SPIO|nr:flagellar basal body rod protein FlgB [Candidatus Haliotispira prima]